MCIREGGSSILFDYEGAASLGAGRDDKVPELQARLQRGTRQSSWLSACLGLVACGHRGKLWAVDGQASQEPFSETRRQAHPQPEACQGAQRCVAASAAVTPTHAAAADSDAAHNVPQSVPEPDSLSTWLQNSTRTSTRMPAGPGTVARMPPMVAHHDSVESLWLRRPWLENDTQASAEQEGASESYLTADSSLHSAADSNGGNGMWRSHPDAPSLQDHQHHQHHHLAPSGPSSTSVSRDDLSLDQVRGDCALEPEAVPDPGQPDTAPEAAPSHVEPVVDVASRAAALLGPELGGRVVRALGSDLLALVLDILAPQVTDQASLGSKRTAVLASYLGATGQDPRQGGGKVAALLGCLGPAITATLVTSCGPQLTADIAKSLAPHNVQEVVDALDADITAVMLRQWGAPQTADLLVALGTPLTCEIITCMGADMVGHVVSQGLGPDMTVNILRGMGPQVTRDLLCGLGSDLVSRLVSTIGMTTISSVLAGMLSRQPGAYSSGQSQPSSSTAARRAQGSGIKMMYMSGA